MSKPRATGSDARLIGVTEVTYGAAPADGYFLLPFISTDLDKEQPLAVDPILGQGRAAQGAYYDRESSTGATQVPLDVRNIGFWLHGLFGDPTTTTVKATGTLTFSGQPAANSTITLNGVAWTFVSGSPTGNQTQIGADIDATLTALAANLNASANAEIAKCTYTADAANDQLDIEFDTAGVTGNTWTLAASISPAANAARSAATLLGGGYRHVFTAGGATPSKVLEIGHPQLATPNYRRFLGVNVNDLNFTMSPRGTVAARVNLVGQQRVNAAASIDASPTNLDASDVFRRFAQAHGAIKVGGVNLANVTAGEFNFTNSPDVVETIRADGLIDGVDMGEARPSGSMTVRLSDSASQATLDAAFASQSPVVLQYGFTHPLAWSLLFDLPRVLVAAPKAPISGPGGIEQVMNWQGENDAAAGYGLRATLRNDVASYA